jgi:hypothetical protein
MKAIYLLACLLVAVLFSANAHAQTNYRFTYDSRGNRLTRTVIQLQRAVVSDTLQAKKTDEVLEDQIGLQKARIYPNPTKGLIRIDLPSLTDQQAVLRVYDQSGRLIMNKPVVSTDNEVDLSSSPTGFYIMVIQLGRERKEWKIIKE